MNTNNQLFDFIVYIGVGLLLTLVFDIFRAYRKFKKVSSSKILVLQDLLYFFIASAVIVSSTIFLLKDSLRLYLLFAIGIGIAVYLKWISKHVISLFLLFFKVSREIWLFIFLPVHLLKQIITKIYMKCKKNVEKPCKKIVNMISYSCSRVKNIKILKLKRLCGNEKRKKDSLQAD